MPKYRLGFKCVENTNTQVRELLETELEEVISPGNSYYDFIGIVNAENIAKVISIKKEMEKKAGNNILSIEINATA